MRVTFRPPFAARAAGWLALCLALAAGPARGSSPEDDYLEALRLIEAGRKAEAVEALMRVVRDAPEHAGALLDLAIVQCEMGHTATAAWLFETIAARFQPPPGILNMIGRMRAGGCRGTPVNRGASWSLSLGRGDDSNANRGASTPYLTLGAPGARVDLPLLPEYLPQGDRYTLLEAEFSRELPWWNEYGVRWFAQLQARVHDNLRQYDTTALSAGAEVPWRLGGWQGRAAAAAGALSLGGRLYQQQGRLQGLATLPLTLPKGVRLSATAALTRVVYPGLADFDGTVREAGGLLEWNAAALALQAGAGASVDRATAGRPGGDRRGWYAAFQARFRVTGETQGEVGASRQTWQSASAYSPGLIDTVRRQKTDTLEGRLIMPLAEHHALLVELRLTRNRENIPVFGYESRQFVVGWQWREKK